MKMRAFNLFPVVILTIAWLLVASLLWGAQSLGRLIVVTTIGGLLSSIVVFVARRTSQTVWIYVGLIVLVALSLPDAVLVEISARLPHPLEDPMTLTILLTLPIALVVAALLLYSGLNLHGEGQNVGLEEARVSKAQRKQMGWASVVVLILSALVLAKALYNFYWFMVWDTTVDSLGNSWLLFPTLAVLFSWALESLLRGRVGVAGLLYLLVIPALMAISASAQSVGFRGLTNERAERVSQVIETYFAREGRYPQDLRQLTPFYTISLSEPMIIFGQGWCYQGGQDYYRLGYLDREHWSSPILFGRVYSAVGRSPLKVDVCQPAIDAYRTQHPDWDQTLKLYGRPTPTPDIGE